MTFRNATASGILFSQGQWLVVELTFNLKKKYYLFSVMISSTHKLTS